MKKLKLTALFIFVAICSSVYSQSSSLGIEGGVNLADISITPTILTTSRTGMMVGGFADIGVSRMFSLRPGVRYVMKGFSRTFNGITVNDKLSYLEIPALIKVSFPLTEVKPYIMAGPTLGIQLSASQEQTDGINAQDFDASAVYQSIDFGLFFGAGVDFHVANKTEMFIGGGYSLGLSNVAKSPTVIGKNYGIQVMGGMKFGL